jgi:hypothetical protein
MRVKVYYDGEADTILVPSGQNVLDFIYDLYGRYLEYDVL